MRHPDPALKRVTPVILCGGAGRRLRPLSSRRIPKPFLKLGGRRTLLQETILRVKDCAAPAIILNQAHRSLLLRDLESVECHPSCILLEPVARNTAPALAAFTMMPMMDERTIMLVLPSDHVIRNPEVLMQAVARCLPVVEAGAIVSFGIHPTRPETGFGYLRLGAGNADGVCSVRQFMEKPDRATAQALLRQGDCVWNSGIFMCRRDVLRAALRSYQPEMTAHVMTSVRQGRVEEPWFILDDAFSGVSPLSIDVAVMEQSRDLLCCPVPLVWNDIGTWMGLLRQAA